MCNPSPVGLVLSANHSTPGTFGKGTGGTDRKPMAYNSEVLGGLRQPILVPLGKAIRLKGWTVALRPVRQRSRDGGVVISYICPASPARKENPVRLRHFYQSIPLQMDTNGSLPHTNQTHLRVWWWKQREPNKTGHDNSWSSAAPSFFAASWPPYQIFWDATLSHQINARFQKVTFD